ncbi:MAG: SRPBCC domain-containing protein [Flavobacteriales bacterium]|nr:SRPBCC domain-containing protein [Flavobacteriales bacterium]
MIKISSLLKNTDLPIIVEQTVDHSIEELWNAITQAEQMKRWFFENIHSFIPKVGFETEFNVQVDDKNFLHQWKIIEVVRQQKITYDWSYREYSGRALVTFELFEVGNQTKIILTSKVVESFSSNVPEFTRESCIGGWNYFIRQNLKEYLDKK